MDPWEALLGGLLLLTGALVLGALCERLKQSALIGYLAAGLLFGPKALGAIESNELVEVLAELGVALLLFTIGLEFSLKRLRRLGAAALWGGVLQIVITLAIGGLIAMLFGWELPESIAIGAMFALSSTASVLRMLQSRAELESVHGRDALGILLMQDLAVVPLVLLVAVLGEGGSAGQILLDLAKTLGLAVALVAGLFLLTSQVLPRMLQTRTMQRNRELATLLAVVMGVGSAYAAHVAGISPAMGAFVAGMLLAESPFATQIRSDIGALRTLLVTLFFSSVGMLADPMWIAEHWQSVLFVVTLIVLLKPLIIWLILRPFQRAHRTALATGICLGQAGEFAFVLAAVASGPLIDEDTFMLVVSVTILTLLLTPYLVAGAQPVSMLVVQKFSLIHEEEPAIAASGRGKEPDIPRDHVILVGFGPAGQSLVTSVRDPNVRVIVVDLSTRLVQIARKQNLTAHLGDACHATVLEHAHVQTASAIVITIPDPAAARQVIRLARSLAPNVRIIARGRYHVYRWELEFAGADTVIDEEEYIGRRLAVELGRQLSPERQDFTAPATVF